MSQSQPTQTTKSTTSRSSKKQAKDATTLNEYPAITENGHRPPSVNLPDLDSVKEVVAANPEETDVAPILEQKDIRKFETSQMGMAEFEAQVTLALKTGHHWLEVPKETLLMVCAGEYPTEHYICYKGLKVAAEGTAKDCMAKEKTTAHEKVFPKDTFKAR